MKVITLLLKVAVLLFSLTCIYAAVYILSLIMEASV